MAFLAACGGSSGNAALGKSFSYGSSQAPSSNEQSAAGQAQTTLSGASSFNSSPDATKGVALADFALSINQLVFPNSSFIMQRYREDRSGALRTAVDYNACTTVTATSITFKNCSLSDSSGFSFTLNGSLTVAAGVITWGITGNFSGTSQGVNVNININESGTLTVTNSSISGNATVDISGSASGQGQSISLGLSSATVINLTYASSCSTAVTGGSVEVKRVWTQKPQGASGPDYADAGVKLTWSGCGAVMVAHSQ